MESLIHKLILDEPTYSRVDGEVFCQTKFIIHQLECSQSHMGKQKDTEGFRQNEGNSYEQANSV